jgi:hypothetical protein
MQGPSIPGDGQIIKTQWFLGFAEERIQEQMHRGASQSIVY